MAKLGLPVPPGFTITTEACLNEENDILLQRQVKDSLERLEVSVGKKFGDISGDFPLLLSVRSGARKSMPGMLDTILNLGLNDETVHALAQATGDDRFAFDCYRRFIAMYSDVVLGISAVDELTLDPFETRLDQVKSKYRLEDDSELGADHLREIIDLYKQVVLEKTGQPFPQDVHEQLWRAIKAVFNSWNNERAKVYRLKYQIPHSWGTACNVQAMVFGNAGENSATGVCFTRSPTTGENVLYGEFLVNAQGEDVVSGARTPLPIANMRHLLPESYQELQRVRIILEKHFLDMQDIEFTIENGNFYCLQTRDGKRTGLAATRIAFEMVQQGLINSKQAVLRVPPDSIVSLLAPSFDNASQDQLVATGLPAGPGAASGHISFTAANADALAQQGKKAILCRIETCPDDVKGMLASEGILTTRGGVSSHAALVARQMGKVAIVGASAIRIDYEKSILTIGDHIFKEGDMISLDGTTGKIYAGAIATQDSEVQRVLNGDLEPDESETYQIFDTIMQWANSYRRLSVRANVDTPEQNNLAVRLGAEGIGLCRTEHMFFSGERLDIVRAMLIAVEANERKQAAMRLLPHQRDDFYQLFISLQGKPITIRLIDPPIHEFLPHDPSAKLNLAERLGLPYDIIQARVANMEEANPMLGHRGVRLGITHPEITKVQAHAIFEAAAQAIAEGVEVNVEVMVPFVAFQEEFDAQANIINRIAQQVMDYRQVQIPYKLGTMIELPRAALTADQIAKSAEFFSFGTNDLTQMCLGMSRDDVGGFLPTYLNNNVLQHNPFSSIDNIGVGALVRIAVEKGKLARPDIKTGICGEHGGDPASIKFFHDVGLDYISCSAPRVPVAILAAAQAAIEEENSNET